MLLPLMALLDKRVVSINQLNQSTSIDIIGFRLEVIFFSRESHA